MSPIVSVTGLPSASAICVHSPARPAFANGQRYVSKGGRERGRFSDPDASWGHRSAISTRKGGGYYGYKLDMAVCTATDLPIAWDVRTARDNESIHALPLIDAAKAAGVAVPWKTDGRPADERTEDPSTPVTLDIVGRTLYARTNLDAKLEAYERATGRQVVVWIGETIGGRSLDREARFVVGVIHPRQRHAERTGRNRR